MIAISATQTAVLLMHESQLIGPHERTRHGCVPDVPGCMPSGQDQVANC